MASTSVVVIRPANGTPDTRSSGRPQHYKVVAFPANEMPNMFSRLARKLLCVSAKSVDIDEKPRRHKSGIQAAKNVDSGPDQDFPTLQGYNHNVDIIRQVEYPDLAGTFTFHVYSLPQANGPDRPSIPRQRWHTTTTKVADASIR